MIDLHIDRAGLDHNIRKARENHILIPTIAQMQHPETIPEKVREKLKTVGLWEVNPLNLFRITWKNEPKEHGGLFQAVPNYIELPPALTGVPCRIIAMVGKWFPTGCHKVGASFGCLAPRLVTGQFDVERHKAVWPSTGNYCRGGAFNSALLGAQGVAILPAEMSRERFDWLREIGAEVIATPGCESNVKEIFDKTNELKRDPQYMIFNQFEEMGNPLWHYNVTGNALAEVFEAVKRSGDRFAGACFTSGSAGTPLCRRPAQGALPPPEAGGGGGPPVPHDSGERLRRPPDRGHRRQAHPLDSQCEKHRHGHRHRRRGQPAAAAPVQHAGGPDLSARGAEAGRGAGGAAHVAGHLRQSPTSCAASRWPSTTSSRSATWWARADGLRRHVRQPHRGAERGVRPLHRPGGGPWTTACTCWASRPTICRSSITGSASGSTI